MKRYPRAVDLEDLKHEGGSGGGDMNDRLTSLEKRMGEVETVLTRINETLIRTDAKADLSMQKITSTIELQGQVFKSALDAQGHKLQAALELQGQSLRSALELQSSSFDGKLKDLRLSLILWILGLPTLCFTLYRIYQAVSA